MENEIDIAKSNMHRKWFVIPYSILVIMCAGAPYNLQERWKFRMEQQGFEESAENYTFLAVLSGYYFGLFSGIVIHRLDSKYAYAIAAILAFVGYVGIGIGIKIMEAGILEISIMIALFFMISFSASLAMMSAVNMPIDCFDRYASFLIIGLLIGYIKITPVFESAIERKWFKRVADKIEDTENRTTLDDNIDLIYNVAIGVLISIVYLIGGFIEIDLSIHEKYKEMVRSVEKNGLYIFTFIEVLLIFALYFISIENKHNEHTFLIILSVLGINFLVYVIAYCLTSRKIEKKMHDYLDEIPEKGIEMSFLIVLRDPKYFGLFIPSLIIIGASSAIYFILIKIYTIEQKIQYLEAFLNIYWLCDALARVFCGLNSFLFTKIFPKFFFGIFGACITSFGFLSLLAYDYTKNYNLMYIGIIGIGSGCGIWWVIAPIIILDDIGSFSFNIVWGGVLTMNFLGLFFFTIIFAIIDIYFSQSLMFVLLIALFSCVLAAFICIYSFIQEMKEKPLEINRGT